VRTALIALNLVVAAASAGLFGYTFFARDHLTALAEDYVIGQTVQHATPAVEQVEAALKNPRALFVPAHVRDAVQAEVDSFRRDPDGYVRALVAKGAAIEKPNHWFADLVVKWKEQLQAYFDKTLASLIRDLRIFSGTNVVAALLAAWLASRARGRWRWHVLGVSILLMVALGLHMYLFIDNLTFFRIIMDIRVGWSYPLFIALTFGYLYVRFGRFVPLAPPEAAPPANPSGPQKPAAVR
jgi:hypothetical protein